QFTLFTSFLYLFPLFLLFQLTRVFFAERRKFFCFSAEGQYPTTTSVCLTHRGGNSVSLFGVCFCVDFKDVRHCVSLLIILSFAVVLGKQKKKKGSAVEKEENRWEWGVKANIAGILIPPSTPTSKTPTTSSFGTASSQNA